jgi:hypothetical protein
MFNSFYHSLAEKFFIGSQLMHGRTGNQCVCWNSIFLVEIFSIAMRTSEASNIPSNKADCFGWIKPQHNCQFQKFNDINPSLTAFKPSHE